MRVNRGCYRHGMDHSDFIQITDHAVSRQECAAIVQRMRVSHQLQPGRVGSGVFL